MKKSLTLYTQPLMLQMLGLGFSSGLPLALTASTLFAWLAEAGVNYATIGVFALVGLPYSFKFLWAPLLDGYGTRKRWLMLFQLLLALTIAAFTLANPAQSPFAFGALAMLLAFFSASQDVVIDALRVESTSPEEQGAAAAMLTLGYRLAMLASGAGALWLSDLYGWQVAYLAMAALMFACTGFSVCVTAQRAARSVGFGATLAPINIKSLYINPLREFLTRPGWGQIVAFIVLFKLADAFLGIMFNPFLLELGFSKTQIATVVKLYGLGATIFGAFIGGWLVARYGLYHVLMGAGLLHFITNLLLVALAGRGADTAFLALCVVSENLTAGIATSAFVAYLSRLCHRDYTATHYALLSALASVARIFLSTASGQMAETLGWQGFFLFSSLLALPSLVLLWWMERGKRSKPS